MPSMKKYKLIGDIVLSFLFDEQKEYLLGPKEGGTVESDGTTVWYITSEGKRYESITTANIIDVGLKRKGLIEIKE